MYDKKITKQRKGIEIMLEQSYYEKADMIINNNVNDNLLEQINKIL